MYRVVRRFATSSISRNSASSASGAGNLFGEFTKTPDLQKNTTLEDITKRAKIQNLDEEEKVKYLDSLKTYKFEEDPEYESYRVSSQVGMKKRSDGANLRIPIIEPKPVLEQIVSPLKQKLYKLNCQQNNSPFFVQNKLIKDDDKLYKLKLSAKELLSLEPSVYLQSYRIKSTPKKATQFLRLFVGKAFDAKMDVKKAITQCHFQKKKLAGEVAELLTKGLKDAEKLGINSDNLYIDQIWVGKDGFFGKAVDIKGRGRAGIISHKWVHIKAILRDRSVTVERLKHEKDLKQEKKKPWIQLEDKSIGGFPGGVYKW